MNSPIRGPSLAKINDGLLVVVVAIPFLGQSFPHGLPLFTPAIVALLLSAVVGTLLVRPLNELLLGSRAFVIIIGGVVSSYVYGLLLAKGPDPVFVIREAANGIAAIVIFAAALNARWSLADTDRVTRLLCAALFAIGMCVAVLGAVKFALLLKGQFIGWVGAADRNYPWGTSLVADYNFFALTLLASISAAMVLSVQYRRWRWPLAGAILFMLVIGLLAGSRRYWAIMPFLLAVQLFWCQRYMRGTGRRAPKLLRPLLMLSAAGVVAATVVIPDSTAQALEQVWQFRDRLESLLDPGQSFGNRFSRWYYSVEYLNHGSPWIGQGFAYLGRFGCQFLACTSIEYPHMPLMSAMLFGGMPAFVLAVIMLVYFLICAVRLWRSYTLAGGLVPVFLVTIGFGSISGNGPLSVRCTIVTGALIAALSHTLCRTHARALSVAPTGVGHREGARRA